jgi:hypothetical protein
VTFGFAERDFVSFSIEARKTVGQEYSSTLGFFKNYELIYVVAEERDLVALRTKYRQPNEQVHLLRLRYYKPNATRFFLRYIEDMNDLVKNPRFYNSLTTNCTTQVLANAHVPGGRFKYNWRILLSGYAPEYFYMMGNLDQNYSLQELMELGLVNNRAQHPEIGAEEFSTTIREGVPKPPTFESPPQ